MSLNKQYPNLRIYLARAMEGDNLADIREQNMINALVASGIPEEQLYAPCKQEKTKTGFDSRDSNRNVAGWRLAGLNDRVDKIYHKIWVEDVWAVVEADIVVVNLLPGVPFCGAAVEGVLANLANFIDPVREKYPLELQKEYTEQVRPILKKMGLIKPVYLVTTTKTEINGTYVHKIVKGSGGEVFTTTKGLIEFLKEKYK